MLTKLKLALLIAAPLAGVATFAAAQDTASGPPARHQQLQKFDQNGDGELDDAERAQMKAAFEAKRGERKKEMLAKYDTNQDGKLDATERQVMRDAKLTERFQTMDKNADGKLTLDEFKAGAGKAGLHRHGRHGHGFRGRTSTKP
jgi:hypothetical protein